MRAGEHLPFVGRDDEVALLRARATNPAEAPRLVQLVVGPAGVGKTRLVREALADVPVRTAWVRCWDDSSPLWPWKQLIAELDGDHGPDDEPDESDDRLTRFTWLVDRLRGHAPLTVVVDDLHLADPASLLFARFLARVEPPPAVLVVATHRPLGAIDDARAGALAELARESNELHLDHLDHAACIELLAASGVDTSDRSLVEAIVSLTRGLPLALERAGASLGSNTAGLPDLAATVDQAGRTLAPTDRATLASIAVLGMPVTVSDAVELLGTTPDALLASVGAGRSTGLLAPATRDGEVLFVHDLVREAAERWAGPIDRIRVHRAAAAVLAKRGGRWLALAASHATALAGVDPAATAEAVAVNVAAAEQHSIDGSLEAAEAAYDTAVQLAERAGGEVVPTLRLAHAAAALAAGHLARARQLFGRAVTAAEAVGDVHVLADAAAGLGGIWVGEHRAEPTRSSVDAIQRRALEAVADVDPARALRLRVRLAAERAYITNDPVDVDAVDEIVGEIRILGRPRLLAEALTLQIHVLLGPDHVDRRIELVDELTAVAAVAGDPLMLLFTECWRAVVFRLADDARAERARRSLALRCDTLRCASIQFILDAMVVGDLVAQARFDEAEAAAAAAVELGQSVGDADAWNYYAAHLALIRYFQGRHAELADFADEAAASPAMTPSERAMATTAAVFALAGGRRGPGETMVAAHRASPEPASYQASTWLVAMFALAQLSDGLGDAELGAEVVDRLTPFRGMSVHLSIAIATLGPVDWPLGVASAAAGRLEAGESAVRAAVIDAERTGHRPAMVLAMADLARICARRPDGVAEAVALLDRALELATQYGMTGWVERWQPDAARLRSLVSTEAAPTVRFERVDGSMWSCRYGDRVDVFPDSVGIRHLAVLCASPDTDVSAARLAYLAEPHESTQPVLDDEAVDALRDRAAELRRRLDEGDGPRQELEDEFDAITEHLLAGMGLGDSRRFSDAGERARTSVRKAITRALERIERTAPDVANHLRERVSTGHQCRYSTRA
jgi:hypothetical protein